METPPSNKIPVLTKSRNMDIWVVVHQINFLFELSTFLHFVLPVLFVLTLASDMVVFYGNNVFSILVVSTKKQFFSFRKTFRFSENLLQS